MHLADLQLRLNQFSYKKLVRPYHIIHHSAQLAMVPPWKGIIIILVFMHNFILLIYHIGSMPREWRYEPWFAAGARGRGEDKVAEERRKWRTVEFLTGKRDA